MNRKRSMRHLAENPEPEPCRDSFAGRLLAWWDLHGRRDLPWQRGRTPYRVWLAEVMLQQTQAATAAPYFERFVDAFPTVRDLAAADLDAVLHLWSGLGYYARGRNLHAAARRLARDAADDPFPRSVEGWMELPGVGRSTAGAIVAQAFGTRAAILDGNARRVLARHHRVAGRPSASSTEKELWRWAECHTPSRRVADYTQAIMDLGATVCSRSRPSCPACPLRGSCAAHAAGEETGYPEPVRRKAQRRLERRRFFIVASPDSVLLERRPESGIWGGLWSPPEAPAGEPPATFLAARGIEDDEVISARAAPPLRHGFSHYDLDAEPVYVELRRTPAMIRDDAGTVRWVGRSDGAAVGLSALAEKLLAPVYAPGRRGAGPDAPTLPQMELKP